MDSIDSIHHQLMLNSWPEILSLVLSWPTLLMMKRLKVLVPVLLIDRLMLLVCSWLLAHWLLLNDHLTDRLIGGFQYYSTNTTCMHVNPIVHGMLTLYLVCMLQYSQKEQRVSELVV